MLCWGGGYQREHVFLILQQMWEAHLCLPDKHKSKALQQIFRLGFFPLAIKLHSHRITTCLRFLKLFVQVSNSYCAESKFQPWLSRPWNPFQPCPGSKVPRTHNKGEDKKNIYTLVITHSVPNTVLNSLHAVSHLILTITLPVNYYDYSYLPLFYK